MNRCADCAGPRPEFGTYDLDSLGFGDVYASQNLVPNGFKKHVLGRSHAAADNDTLNCEQNDHIAHADAEIASNFGEAVCSAAVAGAGRFDRCFHSGPTTSRDDRVSFGKGLKAPAITTVASGAVGQDGLVSEFTSRPIVAVVELARNDQTAPDPSAEGDAQHRAGTSAGAESIFGQREGARIVDEPGRNAGTGPDLLRHRDSRPVPWKIDEEARRPAFGIVKARHADPNRRDFASVCHCRPSNFDELTQHTIDSVPPIRRDVAV